MYDRNCYRDSRTVLNDDHGLATSMPIRLLSVEEALEYLPKRLGDEESLQQVTELLETRPKKPACSLCLRLCKPDDFEYTQLPRDPALIYIIWRQSE